MLGINILGISIVKFEYNVYDIGMFICIYIYTYSIHDKSFK
jgi:hypothetical protein